MAEFHNEVSFRVDSTTDIKLELTYDDSNGQEGRIEIKVWRGSLHIGLLRLRVNPVTHGLFFDPGSIMTSPEAQCVAQCVGIAVGKGLIECLLKSGSLAEIRECLRDKAAGTLLDAALCVAKCLGIV